MSHSIFLGPSSFPPSLPSPGIAMLVAMAHWMIAILCLQWMFSLVDEVKEYPAKRGSYVSIVRGMKFYLLFAILFQVFPRLMMVSFWQGMSPWWREALSMATWTTSIPTAVLVAIAWWRSRLVRPDERAEAVLSFLNRTPSIAELTGEPAIEVNQKSRAIVIFVVIFAITFAVTYIRPRPSDVPHSHAVVGPR